MGDVSNGNGKLTGAVTNILLGLIGSGVVIVGMLISHLQREFDYANEQIYKNAVTVERIESRQEQVLSEIPDIETRLRAIEADRVRHQKEMPQQ